jgi:hypothetical protein
MPEDAVPVLTELIEGFYWGMYDNCMRKSLRSVRLADYDGTTRVVGYVMTFEDPRGSNFPHPIVVIDVYGKEIRHSYSDPEAIESVLSPIDFIGPGFLTKPVLGGARALGRGLVETAPKFGAFVGKNARNLAFSARMTMADSLTATMRGGEQFAALTAESAAPSALIVREGGEFVASSQAARAATNVTESLSTVGVPPPPMPVTGPSFASVSTHLGPQALGTVAYGSTAAAASGALAANLVTADTPGFQTHSTASSVRGAFNVSGKDFESAHIVPQTVYRALRARGLLGAGASEGRALTTLLAKDAHRAFDRGWVNQWHSAVDAGRQITVGDAYTWLRNAINNVGDNLISNDVKGAMLLRLDAELFQDLGLSLSDVIVAARP